MRSVYVLALALALCGSAVADDDAVVITGVRDPVQKSYRKMLEGQKLFEARHALAPAASLRYKLVPRDSAARLKGVELDVSGESLSLPLKVAPDQTFVLEHNPVAAKENARVLSNRKAGSMTWRVDVRTPGLPPNVRRLGDLRLECEVGMQSELISPYPPGFFGWLQEVLNPRTPEFCHREWPRYLFFAERPLFSVTLVDGERRQVLPIDMLYASAARDDKWKQDRWCDCQALFDRTYFVPLGDASWSDDTRVEIETMDDAANTVADSSTRADVRAALAPDAVVDFPSGYEVWLYRQQEMVLLFDPSGLLAKARAR